jgi:hypothetical protein
MDTHYTHYTHYHKLSASLMQNQDSPLKLLRLPSLDGEAYELVAALPPGLSVEAGVALANQIILEANLEDHINNGVCDDDLPVESSIKRRLQAHGFSFPEVGVTQCWDEFDANLAGEAGSEPTEQEGEQVWKAVLYLDGQSVLGEWVGLANSANEVREAVMDLFWDPRLDAGDACPTLHLEKPGEGLTGPFEILVDGDQYNSVPSLITAFNLADLMRETTKSRVTVEFQGEELFGLAGLERA